jgi:branched-chain amino acid transport system ATP-binding protein
VEAIDAMPGYPLHRSDNSVRSRPRAVELLADGITVKFGGIEAIGGVDLAVRAGQIVGLIGPNGAGKTTLVNVLTGFQAPSVGTITIDGKLLSGRPPERFADAGIARTFQNVRLYREMSVVENLLANGIGSGLSIREARERSLDILDWIGLTARRDDVAETLPYGEERRVGIARALVGNPNFLLLDEPAAGMTESECQTLVSLILDIPKRFGCGVLLIEHNMRVVMAACERINVLVFGKKIAEGTPAQVQDNPAVRASYLG